MRSLRERPASARPPTRWARWARSRLWPGEQRWGEIEQGPYSIVLLSPSSPGILCVLETSSSFSRRCHHAFNAPGLISDPNTMVYSVPESPNIAFTRSRGHIPLYPGPVCTPENEQPPAAPLPRNGAKFKPSSPTSIAPRPAPTSHTLQRYPSIPLRPTAAPPLPILPGNTLPRPPVNPNIAPGVPI